MLVWWRAERLRRTRTLKWSLCMQSGWWKGCSGLHSVINRDPVLRSPTMWLTCSLCNIQHGLTVQKIPLSLPHTQSQTHTHYCLHLYASQPPTAISPSSSRGQTIEQLICVLALTKRRSSSSSICISPDAIYIKLNVSRMRKQWQVQQLAPSLAHMTAAN